MARLPWNGRSWASCPRPLHCFDSICFCLQTGTVDSLILNAYPPFHALPSMHQIHEGGEPLLMVGVLQLCRRS